MHFRFAVQKEYQARAHEAWAQIIEHDETGKAKQLASLEFWLPEKAPALQAADLLAHEWLNAIHHWPDRLTSARAATWKILDRGKPRLMAHSSESMEKVLAALPTDMRAELRRWTPEMFTSDQAIARAARLLKSMDPCERS